MIARRQLGLDLAYRPAFGDRDFLIVDGNRAAIGWLDRWPDWPAPALTIHGPAGGGKSHLAALWQARTDAHTVTAAILMDTDPQVLLDRSSAVVLDDADRLAGTAAEPALFHLYNQAASVGGHILLTGLTPPARWPIGLPDLASRLRAAPSVELEKPDDTLLAAVLVKLFVERQMPVAPGVIPYLVDRLERDFATVQAAVRKLDAACLGARRSTITVHFVRDVLGFEKTKQER
ncbi:MAG: HdaA/DnaA family protein [Inquilinaceae bacterium]